MSKISEYPEYSLVQPDDLLLIVTNVPNDPANKKVKVRNFLKNIASNTAISGSLSVAGNSTFAGNTYTVTSTLATIETLNVKNFKVTSNGFVIQNKFTPANSAISEAGSEGKLSFDNNYLYIKTANNVTKRVSLSSF